MRLVSPILSGLGAMANKAKGILPVKVLNVQKPTANQPLATATLRIGHDRFVQVGFRLSETNPLWPNAFWNGRAMVFGDGDSSISFAMHEPTSPQHERQTDRYPDGRL